MIECLIELLNVGGNLCEDTNMKTPGTGPKMDDAKAFAFYRTLHGSYYELTVMSSPNY